LPLDSEPHPKAVEEVPLAVAETPQLVDRLPEATPVFHAVESQPVASEAYPQEVDH